MFLVEVQNNITSTDFSFAFVVFERQSFNLLVKDYKALFFTLLMAYDLYDKAQCFSSLRLLLHQNVTHGFDVLFSVISSRFIFSLVSTRDGVKRVSSSTKTNFGIRSNAIILFISNDTDSGSGGITIFTHSVEPFFVTVSLQGCRRTEKRLPRVTTQWGGAVITISNQWVQGVGVLGDDNEYCLMCELHTETDLRERCVPVGW